MPLLTSDYFSDFDPAGATSGTVVSRGDQDLTISDEASPGGVRIISVGPAAGTSATVSVCGGASTLTFNDGDELVVTCGSVILEVATGTVEVEFVAEDGTEANVTLDDGNSLIFEPETFVFTAPETNPDPVVVLVEGEELTLEPGETVVALEVVVKPGNDSDDKPKPVNAGAKGVIPVAIIGSVLFSVSDVDISNVTFGPSGASPKHEGHIEDVNSDGTDDLLLHFPTPDTGLVEGDTQACLTGQTSGGLEITGCDSIRIVPAESDKGNKN